MFKVFLLLIVSFMVQSFAWASGEIRVDYSYNQKSIYALITGVNGTKQVNIYKIATNNEDKFIKQISVSGGRGEVTVKDLDCGDRIYLRVLQADSADHPNDGQHFRTTVSAKVQCSDKLRDAKESHGNDKVVKYELYESGDFFRIMPDGKKCQITTKVESFKMARMDDSAALYFLRDGNLSALYPVRSYSNQCPNKSDEIIADSVNRYTIPSENLLSIFAFGIRYNNDLIYVVPSPHKGGSPYSYYRLDGPFKDYLHNTCYNQNGKSFNSYIIFALRQDGRVLKVKENMDNKLTEKTYKNLQDFKADENVCK